jgi:hypothetical protein
MVLALAHLTFPRYFKWKEELKSLSLINRQMMQVHTFFIALILFLMGILCVFSTSGLVETKLGKSLSLGLALFWTIRLLIQFFGYSKKLWSGKLFETFVHIFFSMCWLYFSIVFWWNLFS